MCVNSFIALTVATEQLSEVSRAIKIGNELLVIQ
jgi:hypothetical protein